MTSRTFPSRVHHFFPRKCVSCQKSYTPSSGSQKWCTDCAPMMLEARRLQRWAKHLERTFGITAEAYHHKLREQDGVCAICKRPERRNGFRGGPSQLIVDHNHTTKQVRSLICHSCNTAIGHLDDDPELVEKVAIYLKHWGEND